MLARCRAGQVREPRDGRSTVDVASATYTNSIGDALLMAHWTDPDFDPAQRAFCYVAPAAQIVETSVAFSCKPVQTWSSCMRLLERIILVVALGTLLGSSGCARKPGPSYDPFLRFPATAQWAWDDAWNRFPNDPAIAELNIRALARETITDGLAARGYTLAPEGGKVNFRVHYHVGLRKVIKKDSVEGYGSLSLTLVDASTNRNAWVGFMEADVDVSNSEAERRKRLQKEVNKMLKDFPPSQ